MPRLRVRRARHRNRHVARIPGEDIRPVRTGGERGDEPYRGHGPRHGHHQERRRHDGRHHRGGKRPWRGVHVHRHHPPQGRGRKRGARLERAAGRARAGGGRRPRRLGKHAPLLGGSGAAGSHGFFRRGGPRAHHRSPPGRRRLPRHHHRLGDARHGRRRDGAAHPRGGGRGHAHHPFVSVRLVGDRRRGEGRGRDRVRFEAPVQIEALSRFAVDVQQRAARRLSHGAHPPAGQGARSAR